MVPKNILLLFYHIAIIYFKLFLNFLTEIYDYFSGSLIVCIRQQKIRRSKLPQSR